MGRIIQYIDSYPLKTHASNLSNRRRDPSHLRRSSQSSEAEFSFEHTPVAAIGVRGTDFTVFTSSETSSVSVASGGIVESLHKHLYRYRPRAVRISTSRELFASNGFSAK